MAEKNIPTVQSLQGDFHILQKEICGWFSDWPEFLLKHPSKETLKLSLEVGKFLKWSGPIIDRHAEPIAANVLANTGKILPFPKLKTVSDIGEEIRRMSIDLMDGNEIRVQGKAIFSLHEKLDKLAALLEQKEAAWA